MQTPNARHTPRPQLRIDAAGRQLAELRTQLSAKLERARDQVAVVQERAEARERRALRERGQESTAFRMASAPPEEEAALHNNERAEAIRWIQDQMADYGLTMEELDAAECFDPPPPHPRRRHRLRRSATATPKGSRGTGRVRCRPG